MLLQRRWVVLLLIGQLTHLLELFAGELLLRLEELVDVDGLDLLGLGAIGRVSEIRLLTHLVLHGSGLRCMELLVSGQGQVYAGAPYSLLEAVDAIGRSLPPWPYLAGCGLWWLLGPVRQDAGSIVVGYRKEKKSTRYNKIMGITKLLLLQEIIV